MKVVTPILAGIAVSALLFLGLTQGNFSCRLRESSKPSPTDAAPPEFIVMDTNAAPASARESAASITIRHIMETSMIIGWNCRDVGGTTNDLEFFIDAFRNNRPWQIANWFDAHPKGTP